MPELVASDTIRFPLRDSDMLMGRRSVDGTVTPDIDLGALPGGRTVSRRAAHIYRSGRDWRFKVDPAAQSVTTVRGEPLRAEQEVALHDGDRIKLGAVSLVFEDGAPVSSLPNLALLSLGEPAAELRAEEWTFPLSAPLGGSLAVGRRSRDLNYRPDVDLRDLDGGGTVSRQHGQLRRSDRGWVWRVLADATNPTYMNRQLLAPGHEVLLTDGDQLRMGRALVTFTERRQANLVESDKIELVIGPPSELGVEPGHECTVPITVTNLTGRVDWFLLDLLGLPSDWWRILMPDGSVGQPPLLRLFSTTRGIRAGDARSVVNLVIAPPRSATSTAGSYPLLLTATGQSGDRPRRPASAQVEVLPFYAASLAITPDEIHSDDRPGRAHRFRVSLRNDGNSPQKATIDATPPDRVSATLNPANLTVGAGGIQASNLDVSAKRHWWGADRSYAVPVSATLGDQILTDGVQVVASPRIPHWIQGLFGRGNSLLKPLVPIVLLVALLGAGFLLLRPPDIRVTAQPQSVLPGSTAVLNWHVDRGAGGSLEYAQTDHDIGLPDGSLAVQPQQQTDYKLTARNWFGVTSSGLVTVKVLRILSFAATPDSFVKEGDAVSLQWESEGADGVTIDPSDDPSKVLPIKGSLTVHPKGTTTYHLLASAANGVQSAADAVVSLVVPEISRFERSQDRPQVFVGDPVVLSWTAKGFTTLTLSASMRDQVVTGAPVDVTQATSFTVRPLESGTYTLTANNAEGKQVQQTLSVNVLQPRIATFVADAPAIPAGQPDKLSWRIDGANDGTRVSIAPGIGEVEPSGARSINPFQTTTYTLTVTAADGTDLPPAAITVRALPVVVQFLASAQSVVQGDPPITLFWSVQAADQVTITTSEGRTVKIDPSVTQGQVNDTPDQSTSYILKATNASGDSVSSVLSVVVSQPAPALPSFPGVTTAPGLGSADTP